MAPAADQTAREIEALRAENARLTEELAQARRGGGTAAVERERAGLADAAKRTPRTVEGPDGKTIKVPDGVFLSEGLRHDLEVHGRAIDPATGQRLGDWTAVDEANRANASTGAERGF